MSPIPQLIILNGSTCTDYESECLKQVAGTWNLKGARKAGPIGNLIVVGGRTPTRTIRQQLNRDPYNPPLCSSILFCCFIR
jgi:hypothetical protein